MPKKELVIRAFRSEAGEAAWWDAHRHQVEAEIRRRMKAGQTTTLAEVMEKAKRKRLLQPVTIRLATDDVDAARRLAAGRGMGYQTYIRSLLSDAVRREARKQAAK
jgi:predicted DNA binding CopG/RHH family protein